MRSSVTTLAEELATLVFGPTTDEITTGVGETAVKLLQVTTIAGFVVDDVIEAIGTALTVGFNNGVVFDEIDFEVSVEQLPELLDDVCACEGIKLSTLHS